MKQAKTMMAAMAVGAAAGAVFAGLYGDTPDAKHAWAVHDMNRPRPAVITADPGKPPSDAVVLFDGTSLDAWRSGQDDACKWKIVEGGAMEVVPKTGEIHTKDAFGDCQLHIEFATPPAEGSSQGRGNSGVFLMGMHEIQVLDCFDNDTYPDGQCSSVYAENPPLVNACRKPGEWQTYDIVFESPRWDAAGQLAKKAAVTVIHNGVVLHHRREYFGRTDGIGGLPHKSLGTYGKPHPPAVFIELQDHNNPVRFRNIWVRPLTPPEAK